MEQTDEVRMYTVYKSLRLKKEDCLNPEKISKLRMIQSQLDNSLFETIHINNSLPFFPMKISIFEQYRSFLEEVSKQYKMLCMLFVYNGKCHSLNNGSYTEYESVKDAQISIMEIKPDEKIIHLTNKYI